MRLTNRLGSGAEAEPAARQRLGQQFLAAFLDEGQLAASHLLDGGLVDVVNECSAAGDGQGDGQRRADVPGSADDGHLILARSVIHAARSHPLAFNANRPCATARNSEASCKA